MTGTGGCRLNKVEQAVTTSTRADRKGKMSYLSIPCPILIRRFYGYPVPRCLSVLADIEGGLYSHVNSRDAAMVV